MPPSSPVNRAAILRACWFDGSGHIQYLVRAPLRPRRRCCRVQGRVQSGPGRGRVRVLQARAMSVAEELRRLRGESRLLQDHVSRLADREATTSGARGGADAAWSPTRLAMTSAVTGGAAALVATLGSGAWLGHAARGGRWERPARPGPRRARSPAVGRRRQVLQFSTRSPATRRNSSSFALTSTRSCASAWAAISMSFGPIGVPAASSAARSRP